MAAGVEANNEVPQTAPGLLAWHEHAADWERHRRAGIGFPLQPPGAATPPEEDSVSIAAAAIFRAQFAQDGHAKAVTSFFDAIVGMLTGGNDSAQAGHMHRTPARAYFARR